jgi:hypothetical protein
VTLATGGAAYVTRRVAAAVPPANPLGGGGATPPAPQGPAGPALAVGPHGSLTQDGAEAFVDALLFAIQQLGLPGTLTAAERSEAVRELAANFTTLPASHQAALTQARDTWDRVQAGWATSTQADREQFVIGVLVIAFGEEAISQALASSSGAGGGGGGGRRRLPDDRRLHRAVRARRRHRLQPDRQLRHELGLRPLRREHRHLPLPRRSLSDGARNDC